MSPPVVRADLAALDADALAALANRGIVKRAAREFAEGNTPTLAEQDGVVVGTFADGTRVELPPGVTLEAARCSCPAAGVCRHRVIVVLAYQAVATTGDDAPVQAWSPGAFTDEQVERAIGARMVTAARKTLRAGFRARVRRPTADDPVPTVELPSCTVRFLVPNEIGYARVDAAKGTRADAVALAVWAFREADARGDADVLDLMVGGVATAAASGSGVEPALPLLEEILAEGVIQLGPSLAATLSAARRALDAANLRWPVDALDDLAEAIAAYGARNAAYSPEAAAAVLAELMGRHRCVAGGGASLRADVLGTEESAETPLRLLRLAGLGARVTGEGDTRLAEVYLAHPEAGVVLALRRRADAAEGEDPPSAAAIGRRRTGGARLSALAAGNVVTESAVRAANRVVRIGESRVARTTVAASAGAWEELPAGILVSDLDAEAARLAGLPPRVVRPRLVAESVRAVPVEGVLDVAWRAGEQALLAYVQVPTGRLLLTLRHSTAAAGAVDALAKALSGEVRFVAGHLRRHGGELELEPTAVVAGGKVVVPAFAAASAGEMPTGAADAGDPLAAAVREAAAVSAEVVHRGRRHLSPGWAGRARRSADRLRTLGLVGLATSAEALAGATAADLDPAAALDRWADHHLRLLVTSEQL